MQESVAALNDEIASSETRQPYEVDITFSGNGIDDAAEFNGKPVVGTNHFGNLEINSDLSAEEMLAYIALYKSLITMKMQMIPMLTKKKWSLTLLRRILWTSLKKQSIFP